MISIKNRKTIGPRKEDQSLVLLLTNQFISNLTAFLKLKQMIKIKKRNKIKMVLEQMLNLLMRGHQRRKLYKCVLHHVHIRWRYNGKVKIWTQRKIIGFVLDQQGLVKVFIIEYDCD